MLVCLFMIPCNYQARCCNGVYWIGCEYGVDVKLLAQREKIFIKAFHRYDSPGLGGSRGQGSDVEIHANHLLSMKKRLNNLLVAYWARLQHRGS